MNLPRLWRLGLAAALLLGGCSDHLALGPDAAEAPPPDRGARVDTRLTWDHAVADRPGPACTPGPYTVGQAASRPAWAATQLEATRAFSAAVDAFFARFADANSGLLKVPSFSWYNWDDLMEGEAVLDKFLLLAGTPAQRGMYRKVCVAQHELALTRGVLDKTHHFYSALYDAEHTVEGLMYLWSAVELSPGDKKLRGWVEAQANWLTTVAPRDAKTGLFRSHRLGTSKGSGGEGADLLLNLAYVYPVLRAWMLTGKEAYRKWVAAYTGAWAGTQLKSGAAAGVLPYQVQAKTLKVGPLSGGAWYRGGGGSAAEGFDYETYGFACIGRSTHGAVLAQRLARGGTTLALALGDTLDRFIKGAAPGPPADAYDPAKGGFYRFAPRYLPRQFAAVHAVLHSQRSRQLLDAYLKFRPQLSGAERGWLDWIAFNYTSAGLDLSLPTARFKQAAADARKAKACMASLCKTGGKMPASGDDLAAYAPSYDGLDYLDGAMAGKRNRRDGAPSPASVRYYQQSGAMGLPAGVAALVAGQDAGAVKLLLYNDNKAATALTVTGGHYGQHRIKAVKSQAWSSLRPVGCNRVRLRLPAGALATVTLTLDRYALTPTLKPLESK